MGSAVGGRVKPDSSTSADTGAMLHLRIVSPAGQTEEVLGALRDDPGISSLSVVPGAATRPAGDLVLADVAREAADDVVGRLRAVGVHRTGSVHVEPVPTWLSKDGYDAERRQLIAGDPARCIEAIQEWGERADLTTFSGTFHFGGMPQELARKSMRLFAERVMPALQNTGRSARS